MPGFDDFQGALQAATLLFLPMAVVGLAFAFRGAPAPEGRMRALGYSLVLGFAFALVGLYQYPLGVPFLQFAVPVACLWATTHIGSARLQQIVCYGLLLSALGLMSWYAILVQNRYVGWSSWRNEAVLDFDRLRAGVEEALERAGAADEHPYPPGFVSESDLARVYRGPLAQHGLTLQIERPYWLWHTWLTRLFARGPAWYGLYFPGGKIRESAARLEWREYSGAPAAAIENP